MYCRHIAVHHRQFAFVISLSSVDSPTLHVMLCVPLQYKALCMLYMWRVYVSAAMHCVWDSHELLTLTTSGYVMGVVAVCLDVLTTLTELEQVSEIAEAEKPMTALLMRRLGRSSYWGSFSLRKLYCKQDENISTITEVSSHLRSCTANNMEVSWLVLRSLLIQEVELQTTWNHLNQNMLHNQTQIGEPFEVCQAWGPFVLHYHKRSKYSTSLLQCIAAEFNATWLIASWVTGAYTEAFKKADATRHASLQAVFYICDFICCIRI